MAHPIILFAAGSRSLALPDSIWQLPLGAVFAGVSIVSLVLLVVMALWRTKLKVSYETWHASHIVLALVAIGAGLSHMIAWGFYLTDPWKRAFWIAMVALWIALLLYVRIFKPLFMLRRPYRIAELRKERGDTVTLVMRPDGHAGFRFRPGQFGWLTLWGSPFKITGHPFSFSSSAEVDDGRVEMSIRRLGDFTSGVQTAPVGQRVYLDGPYGSFTVGAACSVNVMVAGGVGITPMMSMIRTLADRDDKRKLILIYGSRNWDSISFREELGRVAGARGPDRGACAVAAARRLARRAWLHQCRYFQAPPSAGLRRARVLHLRTERDDGRDRIGARRNGRPADPLPLRTLQLRLGDHVRRLLADKLTIATACAVVLLSLLFAFLRTG